MSHARTQSGAAEVDITPTASVHLHGYPGVQRMSTGVHDPLLASALCVDDGEVACLFVGCDVLFVPSAIAHRAKERIAADVGMSIDAIMVTATHTHSGPVTTRLINSREDSVVPPPDLRWLQRLEDAVVEAANRAYAARAECRLAVSELSAEGLGTNRHDPAGPMMPAIPLLMLWAENHEAPTPIAAMAVHAMHPTVLHEDSTLISGDVPGLARLSLKNRFGDGFVYLHHMGAAGNQSPRHIVERNTLSEVCRLGRLLGSRVVTAMETVPVASAPLRVEALVGSVDLPPRVIPDLIQAKRELAEADQRFDQLKSQETDRATLRTAECDVIGARALVILARAAGDGRLAQAVAERSPARVQVIRIGEHAWVGWPGEVFVEFALELIRDRPDTHVITAANGELHGYLVTADALERRVYEANHAAFASPDGGERLVEATRRLLARTETASQQMEASTS